MQQEIQDSIQQQQLVIDNTGALDAETITDFYKYTGTFKRPLLKLEIDEEEEKKNELKKRQEASLREPVKIDSFYGRYQRMLVVEIPAARDVKKENQGNEPKQLL